MDILLQIEEKAMESSLFETGYVEISKAKVYPEVRKMCEKNVCRNYGTSWACPPGVGTLEECKERVNRYNKMMLFSKKYELEDSFDYEGMVNGLHDFKKTVDKFEEKVKEFLPEYFLFSNEGCKRCKACTYPDEPCRFHELLHPSLEGYGFMVSELAREAGIRYINGANTVTYFGALLFQYNGDSLQE